MARNPAVWLAEKAKTGVADLPRNAAWVASKTLGPPVSAVAEGAETAAGNAANGVADGNRTLRRAVTKALPGGDSVDERLHEARAAVEGAHQAEREAVEKAKRAHELTERVRQVEKQHRKRLVTAASERDEAIEVRVADARRRADEVVEQERAAAESDQADKLRSLEDALAAERRDVESQAQAAQDAAREQIAHAEQRMAEARRLSDEAADAAAAAAREAHLAAEELAAHAEADATEADSQVRSAQNLSRDAASATSALEGRDVVEGVAGPLRERTIAELLPVAAALGIEGRSRMRHDQLVTAITRARSRETRAVGRATSSGATGPTQATRKPASINRTPKKQASKKKTSKNKTSTKSGRAAQGS